MTAAGPSAPRRAFGLATASYVVIGSMVGTGVLTTSGYTTFYTGSNQLMLALWVVGGLVAICGALSLAELAAAMPKTGGDYVFLLEAYGPIPAFLTGWVSFLIGFGGPIALSASASAQYLLSPFRIPESSLWLWQRALASALVAALTVVHSLGNRSSRRTQAVTTVVKLAILSALACAGVAAGWGRFDNLNDRPPLDAGRWQSMLFSLVYISYAYTGWNGAAYIAGDVERPQILLPRAILIGTGIVMALYLALNAFYALAVSAADVRAIVAQSTEKNPTDAIVQIAGISANRLFGKQWSTPLSIALGLTLLASMSAYIMTGPRVAQAMADAGQFPAVAGRVTRAGAPAAATLSQGAWSLILLWTGSYQSILEYSSVGLALISLLAISTVFVLRTKLPDLHRPFRTPGYPVTPAVYLIVTGLLCGAAFWQKPLESSLALGSILCGVPAYWLWQKLRRP